LHREIGRVGFEPAARKTMGRGLVSPEFTTEKVIQMREKVSNRSKYF